MSEQQAGYPELGGQRLAGEPATGAPLAGPGERSDPGGFVHLKALDGLRGLAILLILLYHLLWADTHTSSVVIAFFVELKQALWVGVDLFFALSGFLITGILFDALHSRHFLRNFYGRRVVRIFPLYFLVLAVLGLLTHRLGLDWHGRQWYLITYLANLPSYILPLPQSNLVAIHLWSLSVEEQFYLIWPFLVLLVKDRRRLMAVALALSAAALLLRVALVVKGAAPDVTYMLLPARMDGLLLGGWLALAIRGEQREGVLRRAWPVLLFAAVGIVAIFVRQHGFDHLADPLVNSVGYSLTALASAALIAVVLAPASLPARVFSVGWMRLLGKYSYGIYVWHPLVAAFVMLPLRGLTGDFIHDRLLRLIVSTALLVAICVATGALSYHLFEVHFLRLKRFFSYGE